MTNKEKQEWLKVKYPLTIISDRYDGTYSGGGWLAFPLYCDEVPPAVNGCDEDCAAFWKNYYEPVGKGNSAQSAIENLISQMHKQEDDFEHKLGEIFYKSMPVSSTEDDKKAVYIANERAKFYAPILLEFAKRKLQEEKPEVMRQKESEDERIRKEINTLYSEIDTCISELLKARIDKDSEAEGKALFKMEGLMVATLQDLSCIEDYLEKQKEPHYTKRNALFDKCVENCDPKVMKEVSDKVDEMLGKEQKPADQGVKGRRGRIGDTPEPIRKKAEAFLATMEPPYDADDICSAYETGAVENAKPAEWSETKELVFKDICNHLEVEGYSGWVLLLNALHNGEFQPKQEWSEEDEKVICDACCWIAEYAGFLMRENKDKAQMLWKLSNKLKSIPMRCPKSSDNWKPSEEQMKALNALNCYGDLSYVGQQNQLISLYNDLKKLM